MRSRKLSEKVEAAEAAAALLREEVSENRQALSWREEEIDSLRTAKTESEVGFFLAVCLTMLVGCCRCY